MNWTHPDHSLWTDRTGKGQREEPGAGADVGNHHSWLGAQSVDYLVPGCKIRRLGDK
jgi:hypothetical protein